MLLGRLSIFHASLLSGALPEEQAIPSSITSRSGQGTNNAKIGPDPPVQVICYSPQTKWVTEQVKRTIEGKREGL